MTACNGAIFMGKSSEGQMRFKRELKLDNELQYYIPKGNCLHGERCQANAIDGNNECC